MGNIVLAEERYETCHLFKIQGILVRDGRVERRNETCFTTAELPWTSLWLSPQDHLVGFDRMEEPASLDFQGASWPVRKVTWKRSPRRWWSKVCADTVRFYLSEKIPTPPLHIELAFFGPTLYVPPGCVKFEVVPLNRSAKHISERELRNTLAVTGGYKCANNYKIGGKTISSHEFTYSVTGNRYTMTGRVITSPEVPGNVCSDTIEVKGEQDGDIKRSMWIVDMSIAPLPEHLDQFVGAGFAFAPPSGYVRAEQLEANELVRYVKGRDAFLSITPIELADGGLDDLYHKLSKKHEKDAIEFQIGRPHLAGHLTFTMWDHKANVGYIHGEHAGKGYRLAVSKLEQMKPEEIGSLLRGWRWIEAEEQKASKGAEPVSEEDSR